MSNVLVSFLFGAGVAGWIYAQMERRMGTGNQRGIFMTAGIAFLVAFIFLLTLTKFVLHT